ncbi:MAG: PIN domain-containing protein [Pseudolysinimonas sp.]
MTDAFDADVLIHAATPGRFRDASKAAIVASETRMGSVILLPEVLIKPLRIGNQRETDEIAEMLATFELKHVDEEVADAAVTLGAKYRLRTPDAIHLATAVVWGAERFYTHNTKDFGSHITEVDVVHPAGV